MKGKSGYLKWGLTIFLTVCAILVFYDTFYMSGALQRLLSKLASILSPVLVGLVMAYLLAPSSTGLKSSFFRACTGSRGWRERPSPMPPGGCGPSAFC
ncbi:MAG: hypothetical protein ACLR5H_02980 [Oscillospiraceae bacterium]